MMTSWAPIPLTRSNRPSPVRSSSPSIRRAGNLLGTTRRLQPGVSAGVPLERRAMISGGVLSSLPVQNGQKLPPLITTGSLA